MNPINLQEIILIGSELQNPRIISYLRDLKKKKNYSYAVISTNPIAEISLSKNSIEYEQGHSYLKENDDSIENETIWWLNEWISKKRKNGVSIIDNFIYKTESFWWFIDRRIRFELHEIFLLIKILKGVETCIDAKKVTVYDESNRLQILIPQIFNLFSLKYQKFSSRFRHRVKLWIHKVMKKRFGFRILQMREFWFEFVCRRIFSKYSWKKPIDSPNVVSLTNSTSWRLCYIPKTKTFQLGDFYFQSLQESLEKSFSGSVIELYKIQNIRRDLRVVKEKISLNPYTKLMFLDACMTPKAKKRFKDEIKFFKKRFHFFKDELIVDRDFQYSQINFSSIQKDRVIWFFKAYIPLGLRWKALFDSFISDLNPSFILFINEFFILGRSLVLSSLEHYNTHTFAIQHGFFTELDIGTVSSINMNTTSESYSEIHPVTPDMTAVYGPYYERLLLKMKYPKEKILVSGNPSYDFLRKFMRDNYNNRENDLKSLGLSTDKKTIVFGTQPDFYESIINPISTILDLGKNYPQIQLIIKVHPRENISQYLEFETGSNIPVRVIKDQNIFLIIQICDVFLTLHSTTILDALVLGKPVCTFNFENKHTSLKFLKSKAIIELKSPQETFKLIPKILDDEGFQSKLDIQRQEFLSDQIYKLDGNAAERIVNFIIEKINNSQ